MKIRYTSSFKKDLRKLSKQNQKRVASALTLFMQDPFALSLRNHALQGRCKGVRSITAGYDLRILYEEHGNHALILLLQVGKHEDVY